MPDTSFQADGNIPQKTAQDWVRELRFSSNVNRQTMGVQTDRVTPQLLLASSNKLLGMSQGKVEGDAKDALQYQRIYGPVEYFAERIQKDGGSVARSLLWKATNKKNLDFIGSGSLQPHVNAVFHQSNLSQFVDNSTPMDGIDNSMKVTRIGQGGLGDQDSAPIEMRLVQPSYYGYVDGVRTSAKSPGITAYLTKNVMKGTDGKLYQKFINMKTGKTQWVDSQTAAAKVVTTDQYLDSQDKYVYALGGPKGVRVVKRADVDYILPNSDDAWSTAANTVPMMSGDKTLRLDMGCHHPETPILIIDSQGFTHMVPAKRLPYLQNIFVFGCDKYGNDALYKVRKTVTRIPQKKSSFKKVIFRSGRTLIVSNEHKWWVYDEGFKMAYSDELQEGMLIPRSLFQAFPVRTTEIFGKPVTREICVLMGRIIRSLKASSYSYRVQYVKDPYGDFDQKQDIETALEQLGVKNYNFFYTKGIRAVSIKDPVFNDWIDQNIGAKPQDRKIPPCLLSLPQGYTSIFLDSYYRDLQEVGQDKQGDTWLLSIASPSLRDSIAFMLNKVYTDSKYRDSNKASMSRALQLFPMNSKLRDITFDKIYKIIDVPHPAVMIDIDCGDNVYAAGNGIITHNSKYISQAVPLQERQAPLVRNLDKASGKDMPTIVGKLMGSKWAPKSGMVKAVREDRIDMIYDDGTEGSVPLYKDFPANAKGWLSNYPKVKAGQKVQQGQLLASSNYTDDNGVLATGRNLRVGYLSYKGGTYEDGGTISQTAAKKMAYTTMYKTAIDKDKSIRTAKHLYMQWKPGQFTKEQLENIGDDGVVKPGSIVQKGDPVILGIRTTQASPGTLGKRILSDVTETWQHAHPGVVTDVMNGKDGIRVYAKVSAPLQAGDKMCYDEETQILTDQGWKPFAQLTREDQVYTLDPEKGTIHLQQPEAVYQFHHEGLMYKLTTPQLDIFVTPNHMNLVDVTSTKHNIQDNFQLVQVDKLFGKRARYKKNGQWEGSETTFTLPGYIQKCGQGGMGVKYIKQVSYKAQKIFKLIGLYIADGCTEIKDGSYRISIARKTPEKNLIIQSVLAQNEINWCVTNTCYVFYNKHLAQFFKPLGKSYQKYIPEALFNYSKAALQALFKGLMLGDGHSLKGRPVSYTTTSKKLADDFSRLCLLIGKAGNVHVKAAKSNFNSKHTCWLVQIVNSKLTPTVHFHNKPSELNHVQAWVPYNGTVYCCTVPKFHTLYVRRNGKAVWSGNSNFHGGKLTVAKVLPDDQMPKDSKGRPLEVLFDPLGIVSRCNPAQLMEVGLGKVAQKTGNPIVVPSFMPKGQSRLKFVKQLMKDSNVPWKEDVTDPETGRTIKNVYTGIMYFLPLKHLADTKMSSRGTDSYTAQGEPMGGGEHGSKRIGSLQGAALVGHNAFEFLTTDAKLIRGQANHQFWRSLRSGSIPVVPGEPLAHKKFFAHLQGSGMMIKRDQKGFSIFALSNKDVDELAGPREVKSTDTYQQKSFRPIDGGLFGKDVFGQNGDKWGFIQLDSPLPNPVMQEPLARLLNISDTQFQNIIKGSQTVNGMSSAKDMKEVLAKVDLQKEAQRALRQLKESKPSRKDAALKRYVAIARMRDAGVRPQEFMLDRIPVLPPQFRPITSHGGLTMVADSNYLYSQLLNARDDLREAQGLPQEYKQQGQANIYQKWKELVGLYDPTDVKLKAKSVKGLLKWALGKSPKFSAYQRKVLGSTVDTVGRGVVIPSTKVKLNEIGMPIEMAWDVYAPFVTRKLVKMGYTPVDALKQVKERKPVAFEALQQAVEERPVVMNRAPSLHKLSLMGFNVKLTSGHAIKVNPSIVGPFGMDFDGDSVSNSVLTVIETETDKLENQNPQITLAISENSSILCIEAPKVGCQETERKHNMLSKKESVRTMTYSISLEEIPVEEETKVQKSPTVTEWDVKGYVYVPTIDPATGKSVMARMTKVSKHEGLKMFDCEMSVSSAYSHIVTASEDHSLIALNNSTLELEKVRPEEAKGRCVPQIHRIPLNENSSCLKYITLGKQYPLSYEMGVFLGCMIGDGWVDSNGYSFIACCEPTFQEYISTHFVPSSTLPFTKPAKLYRYDSDPGRFSRDDKQRFSIYMEHEDHWALKEKIGSGAYHKRIPYECLAASKTHLIGVLVGLLATDGHIGVSKTASKKAPIKNIAYHTTSTILRDNIQELCLRLGIKTRVTPYMGANSKSTCYLIGFCLEDVAKLKASHPEHFRIPVEEKEKALQDICKNIEAGVTTSYDIVPFPRGLFCEFSYAKVVDVQKATVISARSKGYIRRDTALKIADLMEGCDWKNYSEEELHLKKSDLTHHTPEEAKRLVDKWISMVRDESVSWEIVDKVTPSTCTEGWDCTVPGPYTFSLSTGTVVQDTVNLHVPVSQAGIRDVRQKMMPERNLISMRKNKILYAPEKLYTQGLYVATRMGQTKDIKAFNTQREAQDAFRRGLIDIDTPIVIKETRNGSQKD